MFVNALPWEEDEARAFCWAILLDLTRATSFWDATAERIEGTENDWLICFHYSTPPDWDEELYWCTSSDDPEPPPLGPGPPPPDFPGGYGDEVTMWAEPYAGGTCWSPEPVDDVPFESSIGAWGGWGCIIEGVGVGDMYLAVYPIAWTLAGVTWRYEWEVFGGSAGTRDVEQAPGFFPSVLLDTGEVTDCPLARLLLSTYIPP